MIVDNTDQLAKYVDTHHQLDKLKAVIVWSDTIDSLVACKFKIPVISWSTFLQSGNESEASILENRMTGIRPGHCTSIVYTSGTTGPPKAVMLSHDNITWVSKSLLSSISDTWDSNERIVSYLPLSHIAAQIQDIYLPMLLGCQVHFAPPDALRGGGIIRTMKEVRPTAFFGVPRVWEKMRDKIIDRVKTRGGFLGGTLFQYAQSVGLTHTKSMQVGEEPLKDTTLYKLTRKILFKKVRRSLGLTEAKRCFSGGASLSVEVAKFFASLNVPIYEIYGQAECSGPHTVSRPGAWRIGYCGCPLEGTETILLEDTKEICYRGRHVFMGYLGMPDQTAAVFDAEGYLHSGDTAEVLSVVPPTPPTTPTQSHPRQLLRTSDCIRITGRLKELLITSGGENIPPLLIESKLFAEFPEAAHCVLVGEGRNFLAVLFTLKTVSDPNTDLPTEDFAIETLERSKLLGSPVTKTTEVAADHIWCEYIDRVIQRVNDQALSKAQEIRKWRILPMGFSETGGEITPTLKVKRREIAFKYSELIDSIYES